MNKASRSLQVLSKKKKQKQKRNKTKNYRTGVVMCLEKKMPKDKDV